MIKKIFICTIITIHLFSANLHVNSYINTFWLFNQFNQKIYVNDRVDYIIISFNKDTSLIINSFLKFKKSNFLSKHHIIFIVNLSKVPSIFKELFILPKLRKLKYNILLDNANRYFIQKKDKITIYKLNKKSVKQIYFLSSEQELDKFFK